MAFAQTRQMAQEFLPLLPAGDRLAAQDRFPLGSPVEAHKRPLTEEVLLQPESVDPATTFWGRVGEKVHGSGRTIERENERAVERASDKA